MKISDPGDMIQIDTKHMMFPGGKKLYQFTAINVLTKQRVLGAYPSESSRNGALFLEECEEEFPFKMKAIQTDNGAPFQKEFDEACKKKNIPHFFIYPRSPKQNSYVESSHGADEREFYKLGKSCSNLQIMKVRIKEWQRTWNEVRPHQALDYLTPKEYLDKLKNGRLPTKDTITLQT